MKRIINSLILSFLFGILLGILIFRNNWFPVSFYRSLVYKSIYNVNDGYLPPYGFFYTPYTAGIPMFSDRTYHDIIGNEELENSNIIQIPRHYFGNIQIEINNEVTVYRILSKKNDNSFLKDWELTNIKLNVRGYSCSHTLVVKKVFNKGLIRLFSSTYQAIDESSSL